MPDLPETRILWPTGSWPSFSADGETIFFSADLDGTGAWRIATLPAAGGGEPEPVTPAGVDARRPAVSWRTGDLAYNHDGGTIHVQPAGAGASAPFLATETGAWKLYHPCWWPDGRRLAVVGFREGSDGREGVVYRLDPQALRPLEALTRFPEVCAGRPTVSPDGNRFVFAGNAGGCAQNANQLWLLEPPAPPRRLEPGAPERSPGRSPRFSPDGRWIAFISTRPEVPRRGGPTALWVIPAEGGEAVRLSETTHRPLTVAWSPDQTRIAFGGHSLALLEVPAWLHRRR